MSVFAYAAAAGVGVERWATIVIAAQKNNQNSPRSHMAGVRRVLVFSGLLRAGYGVGCLLFLRLLISLFQSIDIWFSACIRNKPQLRPVEINLFLVDSSFSHPSSVF